MPLTEAKQKNIQTTNAINFYRGTEVDVWENLLRQWGEDWITHCGKTSAKYVIFKKFNFINFY